MIERNIFEEEIEDSTTDVTSSINYDNGNGSSASKKQSILKKRKKKYYETPLDFINKEIPDHIKE